MSCEYQRSQLQYAGCRPEGRHAQQQWLADDPTGQEQYERRISDAWRGAPSATRFDRAAIEDRALSDGISVAQSAYELRVARAWKENAHAQG